MIKRLKDITECRRFFGEPGSPRQRQYEALRAFYVECLPSAEAAKRFGYAPGAFRVLCHAFRRDELPEFFTAGKPGPITQPKKSAALEKVVALRKRNYSIYEISKELKEYGNRMRGYHDAQARQIFRDLIDMSADVVVTEREVTVRFHRRAHLPVVLDSELFKTSTPVPSWGGLPLRLIE